MVPPENPECSFLVLPFPRAVRSSAECSSTGGSGGDRRAGVHFHAEGTHQVLRGRARPRGYRASEYRRVGSSASSVNWRRLAKSCVGNQHGRTLITQLFDDLNEHRLAALVHAGEGSSSSSSRAPWAIARTTKARYADHPRAPQSDGRHGRSVPRGRAPIHGGTGPRRAATGDAGCGNGLC